MSNTYNQLLTRGTKAELATTPIENGKIRYTTDTNQLYIDGATTRQEISDIVQGFTDQEIHALVSPLQNKFYLSSDTKVLYYYNGTAWNFVGAGYDNTTSGLVATTVQAAIDELVALKLDNYTTITYAEWQLLTPAQKAATNYYIPDYPNEGLTMSADAVEYDNTSSGLSATDVQDAIDEVNSDFTAHTHSVTTGSVGSASAGTAIDADDITSWSAGTAPSFT